VKKKNTRLGIPCKYSQSGINKRLFDVKCLLNARQQAVDQDQGIENEADADVRPFGLPDQIGEINYQVENRDHGQENPGFRINFPEHQCNRDPDPDHGLNTLRVTMGPMKDGKIASDCRTFTNARKAAIHAAMERTVTPNGRLLALVDIIYLLVLNFEMNGIARVRLCENPFCSFIEPVYLLSAGTLLPWYADEDWINLSLITAFIVNTAHHFSDGRDGVRSSIKSNRIG
jgi:hypothetical protein